MIKDEVVKIIKKEISESMNKIAQEGLNLRADHIKSVMIRNLTVGGLVGLGALFLLLGFAKYLPQILNITEGIAFFLIGAILIVVALVYRAGAST